MRPARPADEDRRAERRCPSPSAQRRAFTAATEKYASQVRLAADGLTLENYVAGRPFPQLDPADPQDAIKIMQNYSMQSAIGDLHIRNFDADTGPISTVRPLQIERHFLIGHLRRLPYRGRLYVEPKPTIPIVDKEIFVIDYSDMYDRGGELWKFWINNWRFAHEAFPGAPHYEEITPFIPSIVMVDMQLEHATRASTPSHRYPGEPGWYWHQGEQAGTTEQQFTIAELIESGR